MTSTPTRTRWEYGALDTPVGRVGVVVDDGGLCRVGWALARPTSAVEGGPRVAVVLEQLGDYFSGGRQTFAVDYDLGRLEPTTRAVLTALSETVGYGQTITYGELARRSGTGLPARVIGSIMGSNPVPIVIGCHRVLAAAGLGGFSGGDRGREHETKIWLLEHEGALPPRLW